jgi:hypothetical protein
MNYFWIIIWGYTEDDEEVRDDFIATARITPLTEAQAEALDLAAYVKRWVEPARFCFCEEPEFSLSHGPEGPDPEPTCLLCGLPKARGDVP